MRCAYPGELVLSCSYRSPGKNVLQAVAGPSRRGNIESGLGLSSSLEQSPAERCLNQLAPADAADE